MAYTEIVITRFGDHLVSMLLKDGHPVEFQCVSEKNKVDIGNIYIGVVKNVVKNINGAFVEFDQDEIGFLSMRHRRYKAGDEVLVQIKKEATEEKRPMLSDQIELTGKYLVLTSDKLSVGISNKIHQKEKKQELKEMAEPLVTQEYGFILRTEAAKADKEDVLMEADQLSAKYHEIVSKRQYRKAPHLVDTNYDALEVLVHDIKPGSIDRIVTDQEEVGEQLKEKGYEVYAACANTGGFSAEQLKTNEENAYKLGAVKYVTLDVTQEYYEKSLKYMVYGNVLRNGTYPISVSSERIFQALAIARYANEIGADAIAHGSTGAGNDQVRFDMTFLVMAPGVEIITLTRDMALSRQEEIDYLNKHGFAADFAKLKYSYNVGIWGTSICGGEILDSAQGLPESAYLKHCTKEGSEQLRLTFEKGELKAVNGERFDDPIKAIQKVEEIGAAYGIGRDMHVGDTIIGIKGRVGFEAAAPMLIIGAHRFLEKYTLSKWQQYWKDQVANWYGMFLHESQYLEPVMRDIEAMLESSQRNVNGTAILELHPLCFSTVGVESKDDLVKNKFGEYGEMQKGWTAEDAKGFIKVTSTALRAYYSNHKDEKI